MTEPRLRRVSVILPPCAGIVLTDQSEPYGEHGRIPADSPVDVLRRQSLDGTLHFHEVRAAGPLPVRVHLFLNERPPWPIPPPEEWDAQGCWLFVPSGRLEIRVLPRKSESDEFDQIHIVDMPPGDYQVDAWEDGSEVVFVVMRAIEDETAS